MQCGCKRSREKGFTLIELMVVIALAAFLYGTVSLWGKMSHDAERTLVTSQMESLGNLVYVAYQSKPEATPMPTDFAAIAVLAHLPAPEVTTIWGTTVTLSYSGKMAVLKTTLPSGEFGDVRSARGFIKMVGQDLLFYQMLDRVKKGMYYDTTKTY